MRHIWNSKTSFISLTHRDEPPRWWEMAQFYKYHIVLGPPLISVLLSWWENGPFRWFVPLYCQNDFSFNRVERISQELLLSFTFLPSQPWLMTLRDVLKCLLMIYMMNPKWPCLATQKCLIRTWFVKSLMKEIQTSLHLILVMLFVDRTAVSCCIIVIRKSKK